MSESLRAAFDALDDSDEALAKLDRLCCEPGRSSPMKALGETLAAARPLIESVAVDPAAAGAALAQLEDAGAQVGRLQVGCCAPARMPLYARLLEGLTKAQLAVNASAGRSH